MKVLLVDDNLMSAHRAQTALANLGHDVRVGTAADLADDDDAAVVNLGSRSMDGVGAVAALKAQRPDLPVSGFCGHLEAERRRAAKAAGVDRLATNSDLAGNPDKLLPTRP